MWQLQNLQCCTVTMKSYLTCRFIQPAINNSGKNMAKHACRAWAHVRDKIHNYWLGPHSEHGAFWILWISAAPRLLFQVAALSKWDTSNIVGVFDWPSESPHRLLLLPSVPNVTRPTQTGRRYKGLRRRQQGTFTSSHSWTRGQLTMKLLVLSLCLALAWAE